MSIAGAKYSMDKAMNMMFDQAKLNSSKINIYRKRW
jgi:hypothetical protein